jgi:hypothetical protein
MIVANLVFSQVLVFLSVLERFWPPVVRRLC